MKVVMIGTGYVGLVSGTCFAELGNQVTCIDISEEKINLLKEGKSPIYEPGLNDLLERNISAGRIEFTTSYEAVKDADCIFLAVGTPSADDGRADLKYLFKAAEQIAETISGGAIIVVKSTVPVGTGDKLREFISTKTKKTFDLVNNPEFLKEGSAVEDFMRPDRVIIGYRDASAAEVMKELYSPLVRQGNPIFLMSNISAELSKYASNAFLATKISFINEMAQLCDATGADIEEVRLGLMSDQRIGRHFLYPGPGYGGSCFPKDVKALVHTAKEYDIDLKIVNSTEEVNHEQKVYMFKKIEKRLGSLEGKKFGFWGVAFKPNTDDIRESPAIDMARALVAKGAEVHFYDPVAGKNFFEEMETEALTRGKVKMISDKYECLEGASGLVIMTEWREFKFPELDKIKKLLIEPLIFDARNIFETKKIQDAGFEYFSIGKQYT